MAKYTTEVRSICEVAYGLENSVGQVSVNDIVSSPKVQRSVFNFSFPIFNEEYRPVLESKILKHYYTQEIGEETVGLWKLRMDTRLNEIMPYYNKLYESELIEFDPMKNTVYRKDGGRNGSTADGLNSLRTFGGADVTGTTGHSETETTMTSGTWDLYSDTPQGGIDGVEATAGSLSGNGYLTNARKVYNDGKPDNTETDTTGSATTTYGKTDTYNQSGTGTSTEAWFENFSGLNGMTGSKALLELRETFLNIDMMIIEELQDLFMGVW